MPNWCSNYTHFSHADKSQLERLKTALAEERLFSEFVPNPAGKDAEGWYEHNISAWGTKWDTGADIEHDIEFDEEDRVYTLSVSFDTAWSPPLSFYKRMEEVGWQIIGYYYEPGMNFCGKWEDGEDDYYDIPTSPEVAEDFLPEDINEVFEISQMMFMQWIDENPDACKQYDRDYNEDEHS